jgi:hypothetical protein
VGGGGTIRLCEGEVRIRNTASRALGNRNHQIGCMWRDSFTSGRCGGGAWASARVSESKYLGASAAFFERMSLTVGIDPPNTALAHSRIVCGSSTRIKARRIGIAVEAHEAEERAAHAAALNPGHEMVRLPGIEVPVSRANDGTVIIEQGGKPTTARSVRGYLARAFGDHLDEVRVAMEAHAASRAPEELNRIGFRLYEGFRPDVARGSEGWGAKGMLHVDRIHTAAGPGGA